MNNIKVAIWGLGAMGGGIAKALLLKKGVDIIGVCDTHPDRLNKDAFEVLGVEPKARAPIPIRADIGEVITDHGACDVCVIATDSFVKSVYDKVVTVVNKGVNVITLAEEMAYPAAQYPELAQAMDDAARKNGVSVLGTGINPGLVMDLLAICLSGAMTNVEKVECRRVNSLSPFGAAVMKEQGVGLTQEAFRAGMENGTITGHVGFAESVAMISAALGLGVNEFKQQMSPIITSVDRKSQYAEAKVGNVAGVDMTGQGYRNGSLLIDMRHPQQIEPEDEGIETGDYIELYGNPHVSMQIKPEISGGAGTIAMCVNCIPHVINARPGLRSMLDIPVPRAVMGDFRDLIEPECKIAK